MKVFVPLTLALALFSSAPSWAQSPTSEEVTQQFERLKPSDAQVQDMFSLVLSQLPRLLDETARPEDLAQELAPQMLELLTPQQRNALREVDVEGNLSQFSQLSREQRKDLVFDALHLLTHPSKREWLERMEELSE